MSHQEIAFVHVYLFIIIENGIPSTKRTFHDTDPVLCIKGPNAKDTVHGSQHP